MEIPDRGKKRPSSGPDSSISTLYVQDPSGDRQISLKGARLSIGRSKDNDVEISDISASRQHCRLECIQGRWQLEDLRSRNGTMVNGILIRRQPLLPGDKIEIGKTRIYFDRIPEEESAAGPHEDTLALNTEFFLEPELEEPVVDESRMNDERAIFMRLLELSRDWCSILVTE